MAVSSGVLPLAVLLPLVVVVVTAEDVREVHELAPASEWAKELAKQESLSRQLGVQHRARLGHGDLSGETRRAKMLRKQRRVRDQIMREDGTMDAPPPPPQEQNDELQGGRRRL